MTISPTVLRGLLGLDEAGIEPPGPPVRVVDRRTRADGLVLATLEIGPRPVPALCLEPAAKAATGAGVLYCHAHGGRYDIGKSELVDGRPALRQPPLGVALARAGATVICPDLPGFGSRQREGTESALAKTALWHGRSLLADMVDDLAMAHRALAAMPGVDRARIAACGLSMGGTLAYLCAALDPRIAACAHLAVLADIGPLIAARAHDRHGIYMTIPGLLPRFDMGDIAGLVAPRPQLVCTGAMDALTPDAAWQSALRRLTEAYARAGADTALTVIRDPSAGHEETAEMRRQVLSFIARALAAP